MSLQAKVSPSKIATSWFVRLSSGTASQKDYEEWQAWRAANPDNERSWQKIEQVTGQLQGVSREPALTGALRRLYAKPHSEGRRQILKQLMLVISASSAAYLSYKSEPWNVLLADYSTGVGERHELVLSDGTRLVMNTSTAVGVHFDEIQRTLTLLNGEVLIETGHEQGRVYRPFKVKTQHGTATALGTRFSVRDQDDFSRVSVFDGAVMVKPEHADGLSLTLHAGDTINFSSTAVSEKGTADFSEVAWSQGFIIADKVTLGKFISELSRYRSGTIQCDPALAQLLISGSFPTNTDVALDMLARRFSLKLLTFTRFWVKLVPA